MDPSKAISSPIRRSRSSKEISRSKWSLKRSKSSEAISSSRFFLRDSRWICSFCHSEFKSIELFDQHQKKEHDHLFQRKASKLSSVETGQEDEDKKIDDEVEKDRCWRCLFCRSEFESSELFYQHQKKEHDLLFQRKRKASKLSSVETRHEDEDKKIDDEEEKKRCWRCPFCRSEFESSELLFQHQKKKHDHLFQKKVRKLSSVETGQEDEDKKIVEEEKKRFKFKCFKCNLVMTYDAFLEHKRELHPEPSPASHLYGGLALQKFQEEQYKKYLDEEEKGTWTPCQFCKRTFLSSKDLDQHISEEHHHLYLIGSLSAIKIEETGDVDVDDDDEDKEIWLINENAIVALRLYAQVALQHYNNQNLGKRYALVAPGPNVVFGSMTHINFKAKEEDCSDAPVETFFAQLTFVPFLRVGCCVSLGPSRNLPNWRKEATELNGCRFCRPIINHPRERVANLILDHPPYSG